MSSEKRYWAVMGGAASIAIGTFLPLVSVPLLGGISLYRIVQMKIHPYALYVMIGLLAVAAIAAYFATQRNFVMVRIPAVAAAAATAYCFVEITKASGGNSMIPISLSPDIGIVAIVGGIMAFFWASLTGTQEAGRRIPNYEPAPVQQPAPRPVPQPAPSPMPQYSPPPREYIPAAVPYISPQPPMQERAFAARPNVRPLVRSITGVHANQQFPVNAGRLLVGRDPQTCSVIFPANDNLISRQHASIEYDAAQGMFILSDYSMNGTYLSNGQRLAKQTPIYLHPGERFYFADNTNLFEVCIESIG